MDSQQSNAAFIAKRAERLNLDRLLNVFVVENDAKELRRVLMNIYFHAVNAMVANNECAGNFDNELATLQDIIGAVDLMDDTEKKYLEVKAI